MRRGTRPLLAAGLGLALVAPASAAAATRPAATTGGASNIAQQTAALNGTVNPNGAATTYFFSYGTTPAYGAQTPPASAGAGSKGVKVTVPISGLAPATTYHYRLVAQNAKGQSRGHDRTFKTKPQPLGVSLAGTPNPARTGGAATLGGTLTGTGNAGRQVVLQSNPFPYTQGFLNAGNSQVTDASGNFSFPILSVPVNTQFRVLMPQKPEVVSPIVVLGTMVRVTTHSHVTRGVRSGRVRLSGSLTPAVDGTQMLIQKLRGTTWTTIAATFARHGSASSSRYSRTFWQRRPGQYRVYANVQGAHVPSLGRTVHIRHVRR